MKDNQDNSGIISGSLNILSDKRPYLPFVLFLAGYVVLNLYLLASIYDLNPNAMKINSDFNAHLRIAQENLETGRMRFVGMSQEITALVSYLTNIPLRTVSVLYYTAMQGFYVLAVTYVGRKYLPKQLPDSERLFYIMTVCLSTSLYYVWYDGDGIMNYNLYLGGNIGVNTWHNPTSYAVRPFVVITFFLVCELIDALKNRQVKIRFLILVSLALMASVYAKINWIAAFAPAIFLYLLIWWASSKFSWNILKKCLMAGVTVIPAGLYAIYVATVYFPESGGAENAARILFSPKMPAIKPMLLVMAFPVVVAICRRGAAFSKPYYKMAWLVYLVAALQRSLLMEAGRRASHGNFGWQFHYAGIILLAVSAIEFLYFFCETVERDKIKPSPPGKVPAGIISLVAKRWLPVGGYCLRFIGVFLMGMHLFCGILYLAFYLGTGSYGQ